MSLMVQPSLLVCLQGCLPALLRMLLHSVRELKDTFVMKPISTFLRIDPHRGVQSQRVIAFGSTCRRGSAALQSVMILAVAMTV